MVLAVWLVSVAVFLPARAVVWTAVAETFAALPSGDLPNGELSLITVELLRPVWAPLTVAALSGWLALWAWTVLWHAGVVRWLLLSGRTEVRLAEILGHGLIGWWRWARLGLTSLAVLLLTHSALWLAIRMAKKHAHDSANNGQLGIWLLAVLVVSFVVVVLCWLATLRGSWLLGSGDRRSAALAWLAGLWGSLRQPVRSLVTLALWAGPTLMVTVAPILICRSFEVLQAPLPSKVIDAAAGLFAAFCLVGLFLSFAPVTGLVGNDSAEGKSPTK